MMKRLTVENFAIIQRCTVDFQGGLNVISGETGAGKSILLDSLNFLMGARGGLNFIRQGENEALLRLEFHDKTTVERQLKAKGSKILANGKTIKINELEDLTAGRIHIYGQAQNQQLMKPEQQRQRLDYYAKLDGQALRTAYQNWQTAQQKLKQWQEKRAQTLSQQDFLSYQLQELERLAPKKGEFQELGDLQTELSSADGILQKSASLQSLCEQLLNQAQSAFKTAQQLNHMSNKFNDFKELSEQVWIHQKEALSALNRAVGQIDHDPQRLHEIEERLSALLELARKHRCRPEDLPEIWDDLKARLEALSAENDTELQRAVQETEQIYQTLAQEYGAIRQKYAPQLAEEIQSSLQQLGMKHAKFQIQLDNAPPSASGIDSVLFLLAPNSGQDYQALHKIASGGELSRVSLALEVACLKQNPVGTIIFDEVDTGIGGEIAHSIGKLLKELGKNQQVICITHLAQVACWADHHLAIEKIQTETETLTTIQALSPAQRIIEIARMLGNPNDENSQNLAKKLLKSK